MYNIYLDVDPEFREYYCLHYRRSPRIVEKIYSVLSKGYLNGKSILLKLKAVFTEKASRHDPDLFGLLHKFGDIMLTEKTCGIMRHYLDHIELVRLGYSRLYLIEILF